MNPVQWYYADANGGQQGPFSTEQLQGMVAAGQLYPNTLLWAEGLADWTEAGQIEGLFPVSAAPVPVENPYEPPATTPQQSNLYPLPPVKRTSFGLYLGSMICGIIFLLIAMLALSTMVDEPATSSTQSSQLNQLHANAETPDELREAEQILSEAQSEPLSTKQAAGGIAGMVFIVLGCGAIFFAGIYSYIVLYRAWYILQPGGARTTPGAAVGFLFVPLFSIYWIFVAFLGWSKDWNRIRASYPNLISTPPASEGVFLTGLICAFTVIGFPVTIVCFLIMIKQMCAAINSMVSLRNSAAMSQPGALPRFY